MTHNHQADFDKYGCGSRCLIKLAELHQKPITKAQFCQRFESLFPQSKTFGGTVTSTLTDIARKLELCIQADTMVSKCLIKQLRAEDGFSGALMITERQRMKDGSLPMVHHCRLLLRFDELGRWLFWHPEPNGTAIDPYPLTELEIDEQVPHFLVLYSIEFQS